MSNKIYKTGIYARLSREDADRLESNSIQSQRAICLAYIESHDDLELVDTYIDDGETGSNTDRPGFQRMIQDMRSGRIDCAVSKDLSRFSRNYIDAGNYLEKNLPGDGHPLYRHQRQLRQHGARKQHRCHHPSLQEPGK